jgi:hypothetical protein
LDPDLHQSQQMNRYVSFSRADTTERVWHLN